MGTIIPKGRNPHPKKGGGEVILVNLQGLFTEPEKDIMAYRNGQNFPQVPLPDPHHRIFQINSGLISPCCAFQRESPGNGIRPRIGRAKAYFASQGGLLGALGILSSGLPVAMPPVH